MQQGPRPRYNTAFTLFYINIGVNGLATLLTIALIIYMKKKDALKLNLYTRCLLQMTIYQLLFELGAAMFTDVGNPFNNGPNGTATAAAVSALVLGGCGASMWSLLLLVAAMCTVQFGRGPRLKEEITTSVLVNVCLVGFTIPFTLAGLVAYDHRAEFGEMMKLYSHVRNATIIISLLVLLRIYYILRQTSNQDGHKSNNHPLYHLLQRLVCIQLFKASLDFVVAFILWYMVK